MKREDQCEDCTWNDQGDCLCGHDVVPFDCPDYESEEGE